MRPSTAGVSLFKIKMNDDMRRRFWLSILLRAALAWCFCAATAAAPSPGEAASLTRLADPDVDAYNLRLGTQTFAGLYQFTTNTLLVETAQAIQGMGSDVIKFYMGPEFPKQYRITLPGTIGTLTALARDEPSCRKVFDMPFRHYIVWAYPFTAGWWADGYSSTEKQKEYTEIYALTRYFLTNYNGSGKTFYLGHWEGDWHLLGGYDATKNPTGTAIQGMRDWLNNRQRAVDDAKRDVAHTNVDVFNYTEVNRVRDAMGSNPAVQQRVVNMVVPFVPELDFVSWSSYDGQDLTTGVIHATLSYIEANMSTNKAASITGRRVWVGEYGWGGVRPPSQQEPGTRVYTRQLLIWGCRFALFWEIYNNETNRNFCLIDPQGKTTPSYDMHQRYYNAARLALARFKEANGRLPSSTEFTNVVVLPILSRTVPAPVPLEVTNLVAEPAGAGAVRVSATLTQGVYGDDPASVYLAWGAVDGGTNRAAWDGILYVGRNLRFTPTVFSKSMDGLPVDREFVFRMFATNATSEVWSVGAGRFVTGKPRLGIQKEADNTLRVSWPSQAGTFQLQAAVQSGIDFSDWTDDSTAVVVEPPGEAFVRVGANAPARFFRLRWVGAGP